MLPPHARTVFRQPCPTFPHPEPRKNNTIIITNADGNVVDLKSISANIAYSPTFPLPATSTPQHQYTESHTIKSAEEIKREFSERIKQQIEAERAKERRKEEAVQKVKVEGIRTIKHVIKEAEMKEPAPVFSRPELGKSKAVVIKNVNGSVVDLKNISTNISSSSTLLRSASTPQHQRTESRTTKSAEEIKREFSEQIKQQVASAEQKSECKENSTFSKRSIFRPSTIFRGGMNSDFQARITSSPAFGKSHRIPESQMVSATMSAMQPFTSVFEAIRYDSQGYCLNKILDRGGSGIVASVMHQSRPGLLFAQKQISKSCVNEQVFLNEVRLINEARHRHVISIFDQYQDDKNYYIVMEPVANSNLKQFLQILNSIRNQSSNFEEFGNMRFQLFKFLPCLAATLKELHDRRIRHRDIKLENILIHDQSIILTDFGTSFITQEATRVGLTRTWGTDKFEPPEAFMVHEIKSSMDTKTRTGRLGDVFSLGCVFYEILEALCVQVGLPLPEDNYAKHFGDKTILQHVTKYSEHKALVSRRLPVEHRLPGLLENMLQVVLTMVALDPEERKDAAFVSGAINSIYDNYPILKSECCNKE